MSLDLDYFTELRAEMILGKLSSSTAAEIHFFI